MNLKLLLMWFWKWSQHVIDSYTSSQYTHLVYCWLSIAANHLFMVDCCCVFWLHSLWLQWKDWSRACMVLSFVVLQCPFLLNYDFDPSMFRKWWNYTDTKFLHLIDFCISSCWLHLLLLFLFFEKSCILWRRSFDWS